jgi:23S rRNA (uracil1939-C5)-methyltransferase
MSACRPAALDDSRSAVTNGSRSAALDNSRSAAGPGFQSSDQMAHCRHYGFCGGCAVDDRAAIDKSAVLRNALIQAGYEKPAIATLVEIPLQTRRRVDLAASRNGAVIALGLHKARSTDVVDMQECVLLDPRIVALLPPLRVLLRSLEAFRRNASVVINWLDHGPDILFRTDADITAPDRSKIVAFARLHQALRISFAKDKAEPEPIIILRPPVITLSGIAVEPGPGAFLQASAQGEAAIIAATVAGLPKLQQKSRIAELYAGIGTLTFALVNYGRVEAYEGAADAVAAQELAIRKNNLAGRIKLTARDLARRPLQIAELKGCAAVVLDPPYSGASSQIKFLTAAAVPRLIYVSCNPKALAIDAYALKKAGYALVSATPIDQFPYSDNLESVMVFELLKQ